MKECGVCHAKSEDSAMRCTECGRPFLYGSMRQKQCPACKRGNPQSMAKCVYCGSALE